MALSTQIVSRYMYSTAILSLPLVKSPTVIKTLRCLTWLMYLKKVKKPFLFGIGVFSASILLDKGSFPDFESRLSAQ